MTQTNTQKLGTTQKLGWIRDLPDHRDYRLSLPTQPFLPTNHDIRYSIDDEPIYDQLNLGSCTANAVCSAFKFLAPSYEPSRMFLYYNTRVLQNTVNYDSGSSIRLAFSSLSHLGVPPEYTYPYNPLRFTKKPSLTSYKRALPHQSLTYLAVDQNIHALNSCLYEGFPFVFGFSVFPSFFTSSPYKPFPGYDEPILGGHAVLAVGYTTTHYICRNSWGPNVDDFGYFYLPIHYVTNPYLAADFWTLRSVELQNRNNRNKLT